eukprot:gene23836-24750_t
METVDEALREYLLFRGFTHTLRTFEAELRHDKDKAFQSTKIVNQIFVHVTAFELGGLCEFWDHLSKRFFSRLE